MRVLLVVHEFLPRHTAGTERYTHGLAGELGHRGAVCVLAGERDPGKRPYSYQDEEIDNIPVRRVFLPDRHHYGETYLNPALDPVFSDLINKFRPDIVHFQHLIYLSTSLLSICRYHKIPAVMTLHDYWLMCPMGQLRRMDWRRGTASREPELCPGPEPERCFTCMCPPLGRILDRGIRRRMVEPDKLAEDISRMGRILMHGRRDEIRNIFGPVKARLKGELYLDIGDIRQREKEMRELVKQVRLFISPSSFLRDRFVEWGIPAERIIHLDNGTDTMPFERYRAGHGGGGRQKDREDDRRNEGKKDGYEPIKIGFVGTVRPYKGPHVLLEALRYMKERDGVRVMIYGDMGADPPYSEHLRGLAKGMDVSFPGRFEEADKPGTYNKINALVIPSIWYENSPVTIHEAFAAGTPVIASELGGIGELVEDGVNGMLFEAGNVRELAGCLERFVRDGKLREQLRRGIPRVKDMEEHGGELVEIYDNVIVNGNP